MIYTHRSWKCRFLRRALVLITYQFTLSLRTLDIGSTIYNSSNVSVGDESIHFVKYQWAKASDSDMEEYRQGTYRNLSHIVVPAAIYCKDASCKDCEHRHQIEEYYDNMCKALSSIGKLTIPTCRFMCSQEFTVPGFNEQFKRVTW